MSESNASPGDAFVLRFRRELRRRVGGRVGGLEIRRRQRQLVVSCTVPSYHVKQMVIVAALTALSPEEGHDVVLNVRVSELPPLPQASGGDGAAAAAVPLSLSQGHPG
jgi:hypothetical protein